MGLRVKKMASEPKEKCPVDKNRIDKLIKSKEKQGDTKDLPFLQSLGGWFEKTGKLSEKQINAFDRIEYLNSPEGKREVAFWAEEYTQSHREKALVCARYYLGNPPYFSDIAERILAVSDYIPSRKQFKAMCENNYTTKVWAEHLREPRFAPGDMVQLRSQSSQQVYNPANALCVVVETNLGITTHAKGGKTYRLLPVGSATMIERQERYIKPFRNKA